MFSFDSVIVFSFYIYISDISKFLCKTWGRDQGSFLPSPLIWISSCSNVICWKDISFPVLLLWQLRRKSIDHICMGLFLDFMISYIDLFICYAYSIRTWSLYVKSISWNQFKLANFILLFPDCFGNSGSLHFHINTRISLSISVFGVCFLNLLRLLVLYLLCMFICGEWLPWQYQIFQTMNWHVFHLFGTSIFLSSIL